jgi:anti-sigma factor RsiW
LREPAHDVFVWPVEAGAPGLTDSKRASRGYTVVRWNEGGMSFCAVSDVSMDDLQHLMTLIRTASTR